MKIFFKNYLFEIINLSPIGTNEAFLDKEFDRIGITKKKIHRISAISTLLFVGIESGKITAT